MGAATTTKKKKKRGSSSASAASSSNRELSGLEGRIARMSYPELLARREEIVSRLGVIGVDDARAKKGGGGRTSPKQSHSRTSKRGMTDAAVASVVASGETPAAAAAAALADVTSGTAGGGDDKAATTTMTGQTQQRQPQQAAAAAAAVGPLPTPPPVPFEPKTDTHWDYVMKEMMWLAADFQSERKRQISTGKKLSMGVRQFHKTKETRRLRELAEVELKRRRLAHRMARDVKQWWNKIERVIAYKQRMDADVARRKAMDKHLVFLVKQTEKYGESLAQQQWGGGIDRSDNNDDDDDDDDDECDSDSEDSETLDDDKSVDDDDGDDQNNNDEPSASARDEDPRQHWQKKKRKKKKKRKRKRQQQRKREMTIEEALAAANASSRQSKKMMTDYTRVKIEDNDDELYGESTTSGSGTDDDYDPNEDDDEADDETTLIEAVRRERDELLRRRRRRRRRGLAKDEDEDEDEDRSFVADPEEIRKLAEESEMDIEVVLERLATEADAASETEAEEAATGMDVDETEDETNSKSTRRVTFALSPTGNGNEADSKRQASGDKNGFSEAASKARGATKDEAGPLVTNGEHPKTNGTKHCTPSPRENSSSSGNGSDADDDADASDVEDFINRSDDDDESDGSEEFEADRTEVDDETTIEAEERLGREMSSEEEIALLQRESEMSLDDLRSLYLQKADGDGKNLAVVDKGRELNYGDKGDQTQNDKSVLLSKSRSDDYGEHDEKKPTQQIKAVDESNDTGSKVTETAADEDLTTAETDTSGDEVDDEKPASPIPSFDDDDIAEEDEFHPSNVGEVDDETTIEAEERLGRDMSHEEEIAMLQRESEIPVEELRKTYAQMEQSEGTESSAGEEEDFISEENPPLGSTMDLLDDDDHDDEDEFHLGAAHEVDDETTIEAEEKLGRDISYQEEIEMLKRESEMPVEELRAMYAKMNEALEDESNVESESQNVPVDDADSVESDDIDEKKPAPLSSMESMFDVDDSKDEDEFRPEVTSEIDDETTMEQEEKLGREMSCEEEIDMLKKESEIPVEQLRAMYANIENDADSNSSVDEALSAKRKLDDKVGADRAAQKKVKVDADLSDEDEGKAALLSLQAADEKARRTTVSRPFLLSSWVHLREYQQIGLNWLVSIQTRRLNGILADEMGLGKTLQTISLFAYLASYKGIWGPHLIIVPTSCIVNWEMEVKRFCPAFKVLCYYGSAKRRKELRNGWTKPNWHHVVVTSYQLAVQDSFAFKRKRWYYLVLDEAQNIKNFQSQRWQTLVNFNSQRRLLLTGTPLQNNLMELWSLLHFLMPHVFRSRKEFSYWFSNPLNNIIEGNTNRNDELISRLHGIIRPFVLRRLKKDVETQMPGKYEHIIKCQLSRRQMFLYEEFMARSSTRMALQKGGNYMGMMNVLMQLRKVCNHPDLFEPRSVVTPFVMEPLSFKTAGCVIGAAISSSVLNHVSSYLTHPIWSCGCGIPSFDACSSHDELLSGQLRRLKFPTEVVVGSITDDDVKEPKPVECLKPGLESLLLSIWNKARQEKEHTAQRNADINRWRCRCPSFAYSEKIRHCVKMDDHPFEKAEINDHSAVEIASTPNELLAMRRSQQELADDLEDVMKKFVFCVPKAGARKPTLDACKIDVEASCNEKRLSSMLLEPLESYYRPFRKANARLSSFFPDKKLVQFDSGKLQTLAELLRELKRGGHRALIFTQMSKMLDILEAFLNLHGHTYLRLDGSTGVDRRQRLMDRFNNDTKVFCFILSTRSGGLGINLTGADTVVFYDSDWNPAMDAQAQDRAHRIGQTRDVHIYRLITEHTVEENILIKAKQKRHLDFLVMDEGKFHAVPPPTVSAKRDASADTGGGEPDVFTKGGLRDILGIPKEECEDLSDVTSTEDFEKSSEREASEPNFSKEQMEKTMASLEDEDDVLAMRGAQKEAADELKEFDETIQLKKDDDGEDGDSQESQDEGEDEGESGVKSAHRKSKKKPVGSTDAAKTAPEEADLQDDKPTPDATEEEMEEEFVAWRKQIGMDSSTIDASLKPTERYGLRFREEIDPFYSIFYLTEQQRMQEAAAMEDEWDVEELEAAKAEEERRAMEVGDLVATHPQPEMLPRQKQLYLRERARIRAEKKRRKLTGENWETRTDGMTNLPFWYNIDTGEAIWDKPMVLIELEADELAHRKQWCAMPLKPLVHIMSFLIPYPERTRCSLVCRQWRAAATDISFVKHVLPVEMGALSLEVNKMESNHFRTISDALSVALPGDTIELGDGHYWVNEPGMSVDFPLRIVGDENDPSHVVIELSGSIFWKGHGGWMEGVTVRRPRISSQEILTHEILRTEDGGRFDMAHCVLDNEGSHGSVAVVHGPYSNGRWEDVQIRGGGGFGGLLVTCKAEVELLQCRISENQGAGIICSDGASVKIQNCDIEGNNGVGILLKGKSRCQLQGSRILRNSGKVIEIEEECIVSPFADN